ncbi:programmed cell death 6-interacting protein-like [Limulus polyphemus]|uniref:Programmed cell death 6-interacting protein-like n=1 Tax=Limulus polyphemus TaxID=6850 RepID=A0ABM1C2L8_LIMPO|nr:programmed cell death 6-interacting protein-like [Limulus polyphemus]
MANFIAVPFKKTSEVDIIKPLKNLISSYYSTADEPADFRESLKELNKLRLNSTWRTLDKNENSLQVMCRYYDQITVLEGKCPPSDVQIPFRWKDAFDKGSFFSGSTSLTLSNLSYERICILFNIAAMQSQIAASQGNDLSNDDALKSAAKYFQQACGIFHYLKTTVLSSVQQEPTPDIQPDTLGALQALMLAQAQESFFHKATADNMKDAIVAKVASQCEELYADTLKQLQKESLKQLWDKEWVSNVAGKQAAFHAISEYHQALVCRGKKEVGEELARLQHANELMKAAETRGNITFSFGDYAGKISRAYQETKKDNDFIYHARIPDVKSLPPIGKAALAKPTPMPEKLSSKFQDLFSTLMPVPVTQAIQAFDVRKTEVVNQEIGRMREQTQMMNGVLASLNLPAAIEDSTGNTLPQSLKDKAQAVTEAGGIQTIQNLIIELPALLQRNREILDEAERMLNEEEASDNQFRNQFKEKWTRTPSEKLNQPLKVQATKYREIIENAVEADAVVKDKFSKHKNSIELLSLPESELSARLPSASPVSSLGNSHSVQKLKQLMQEVEQIKTERETLEKDFQSVTIDMKTKFMDALAQDGAISEQAISAETLGEIFGPLQKRVRENLEHQEKTMAGIQQANTAFCQEKQDNQSSVTRDTMMKDLAGAHDAYMELKNNLKEGTKFYNDLTQLLVNFQNKINDFCFARKTERDELCKELQQSIANQPTGPAPSLPSHHSGTSVNKPEEKERPSQATPQNASAPASLPYPTQNNMPQAASFLPYPQFPAYPTYATIPMPRGYNPYSYTQQSGMPPAYPPAPTSYPPYGQYPNYPPNTGGYPYPGQPWNPQ